MDDLSKAAEILNEIASDRCDVVEIGLDFREDRRNPGGEINSVVSSALLLDYLEPSHEYRSNAGPFISRIGPQEAPNETALSAWEGLIELLETPTIQGRFCDLLWIHRHGELPHEFARAAIKSYLEASRSGRCTGLDQVFLLMRAAELVREINARNELDPITELARNSLDVEVAREDASQRSGITLRLVRLLATVSDPEMLPELREKMTVVRAICADEHPTTREAVVQHDMRLVKDDPAEIECLQIEIVNIWIDWALNQTNGMRRRWALNAAMDRAHGARASKELRTKIGRMIQEIGEEDLDLQTVSVDVEIPAEEIDKLGCAIVGDDGIGEALRRFVSWGPPTGDLQRNIEYAETQLRERLYLNLVPISALDHLARPVKVFNTDDEKLTYARNQEETNTASFNGNFAGVFLDRIGERYEPRHEEISTLFETDLIEPYQANAFASAYCHFWRGRFDESIHVALPRVEAVIRKMYVSMGGIAYLEPRGGTPGRDKGLGTILHELASSFPDLGWHRALWVVLVEPIGLNLRNKYAHGQVVQPSKLDAALVLQIAAYLRILVRTESDSNDSSISS